MNNILTPILASAQLLPMLLPTLDPKSQQLLEMIQSNARRGASLVKQILAFARGMEGDRMTVQVKHVLAELEQVAKSTFPKSIEFARDFPEENLWLVSADPTQLHQVFMNLYVNARDAMPQGGVLSVKAENFPIDESFAQMRLETKPGPYVVMTVSDTGVGMSPEVQDRIFDPFFTTKAVDKGTGLGLSTVLGIVKSHGGFIEVQSAVGKGSQFKVYLPATESVETWAVDASSLPSGRGELILVVDDEAPIRQITKTVLENYNYRVLTANNGIEAIEVFHQFKDEIHLVLTDLMMPEMEGELAIQVLRQINPNIKVITASGVTPVEHPTHSAGVKANTFLSKPYTAQDLLTTMHRVLQN